MKTKRKTNKNDSNSFWNWNEITHKRKKTGNGFPVAEFLHESRQKVEEVVSGPGGGIGIGCGVGIGLGLVGGFGYGGWPWNHLKLVFGVGLGCGVGVGFGYGQGFGYGLSLESLEAKMSKPNTDFNRRALIEI